mmetsp:Transcript_19755/g.35934  ORF Transcript_19755/g.35934 Transcript_19755/m.35934 type:complete len:329 (+) Transcript_19755:267-1253(+)
MVFGEWYVLLPPRPRAPALLDFSPLYEVLEYGSPAAAPPFPPTTPAVGPRCRASLFSSSSSLSVATKSSISFSYSSNAAIVSSQHPLPLVDVVLVVPEVNLGHVAPRRRRDLHGRPVRQRVRELRRREERAVRRGGIDAVGGRIRAFRPRVRGDAGGGFGGDVAGRAHGHPQSHLLDLSREGEARPVVEGRRAGGVGWRPAYLVERHEVFGYGREGGGGGFFYEVSGGVSFDGRASRRRIVLLLFGIARRCSSTSGIRIIAAAATTAAPLLLQPPLIRPPHPILPPPSPLLLHDPVHHAQHPFLRGPRPAGIVCAVLPASPRIPRTPA